MTQLAALMLRRPSPTPIAAGDDRPGGLCVRRVQEETARPITGRLCDHDVPEASVRM